MSDKYLDTVLEVDWFSDIPERKRKWIDFKAKLTIFFHELWYRKCGKHE